MSIVSLIVSLILAVPGPFSLEDQLGQCLAPDNSSVLFEQEICGHIKKYIDELETASIVIWDRDRKVLEYPPYSEQRRTRLKSITKSFISLMIGHIVSHRRPNLESIFLEEIFPEVKNMPIGNKVQVKHLLDHSSCIGNEEDSSSANMKGAKDWVKFVLAQPLVCEPGENVYYNNYATNLLPEIIKRTTGIDAEQYFRTYILEPMKIEEFYWARDPAGNLMGMAGMEMKALDVAKIGSLVVRGGVFDGRRIIPNQWIKSMIEPARGTVGKLWYKAKVPKNPPPQEKFIFDKDLVDDIRFAAGSGGQAMYILKNRKMVSVQLFDYANRPEEDTEQKVIKRFLMFQCFVESLAMKKERSYCIRDR